MSKLRRSAGLFDEQNRLEDLSKMNDPLEKINSVINWERFRPEIEKVFDKKKKSNAGRKSYDKVMMFKILVLGSYY